MTARLAPVSQVAAEDAVADEAGELQGPAHLLVVDGTLDMPGRRRRRSPHRARLRLMFKDGGQPVEMTRKLMVKILGRISNHPKTTTRGTALMVVVTQGDRTYQASDLASTNRRRFIDEAREGVARLRDRDGMGLVMLPEAALATLSDLRAHFVGYLSLENAVRRPRDERRPTDFGEMAWAAPLDDDDLDDLIAELRDALATAAASRSVDVVEDLLHAWRATAAFAGDADAMARLRHHDPDDMVEVPRPRSTEDGD